MSEFCSTEGKMSSWKCTSGYHTMPSGAWRKLAKKEGSRLSTAEVDTDPEARHEFMESIAWRARISGGTLLERSTEGTGSSTYVCEHFQMFPGRKHYLKFSFPAWF